MATVKEPAAAAFVAALEATITKLDSDVKRIAYVLLGLQTGSSTGRRVGRERREKKRRKGRAQGWGSLAGRL